MKQVLWTAGLLVGAGILFFEVFRVPEHMPQSGAGGVFLLVVVACLILGRVFAKAGQATAPPPSEGSGASST